MDHLLCRSGTGREAHAAQPVLAQVINPSTASLPMDAAILYADAAQRWHEFGNVPERAYALLGQGRCLSALGDSRAEQPLTEARGLFASMGYAPALAETEALLAESRPAAS
jgi:hypothetical protein